MPDPGFFNGTINTYIVIFRKYNNRSNYYHADGLVNSTADYFNTIITY